MMIGAYSIARPDSVLEYSCFEEEAQSAGSTAGPIFTGSGRWNPGTIPEPLGGTISYTTFMGTDRLTNSINQIVIESLGNFSDNFPDPLYGGKVGGPSKGCPNMMAVWMMAKCENMNREHNFMRFEEMVSLDPRGPPLSSDISACSENRITTELIGVSDNNDGQYAAKDDTVTYIDYVGGNTCADPIPTGLLVYQYEYDVSNTGNVTITAPNELEDHICSTPGCYYDGSGSCTGP